MKKLLAALICLAWLASPAYAQKTKAAITTEINTDFADNTSGAITPALLRAVVTDIVNSYLDMNGAGVFSCGTGGGWIASLQTTSQTCITPTSGVTSQVNGQQLSTPVMLGMNLVVTPQASGNLYVSAEGYAINGTAGDGCAYQLRYGNGTPPALGATAQGTALGLTTQMTEFLATQQMPWSTIGYLTGQSLTATELWFDVAQNDITAGSCIAHNVVLIVLER